MDSKIAVKCQKLTSINYFQRSTKSDPDIHYGIYIRDKNVLITDGRDWKDGDEKGER